MKENSSVSLKMNMMKEFVFCDIKNSNCSQQPRISSHSWKRQQDKGRKAAGSGGYVCERKYNGAVVDPLEVRRS